MFKTGHIYAGVTTKFIAKHLEYLKIWPLASAISVIQ